MSTPKVVSRQPPLASHDVDKTRPPRERQAVPEKNDEQGLTELGSVIGNQALAQLLHSGAAPTKKADAQAGAASLTPRLATQLAPVIGNRALVQLLRANPMPLSGRIQRLHGAVPQNFTVTGTAINNAALTITTNKSWTSSTGNLADLSDVDMREQITFNHDPATDMPGYPLVVPTIPRMTLVGNVLTKVAGAMHTGGGSDNHSGAGFGPSFSVMGQPNLTKGAWTLIGTQNYEYRDRGAGGPWTPLHPASFTITRTMALNAGTHQYEMTFSKTGPFGVNAVAGPTPITMTTSEAIQGVAAARPDQTPLWNTANNQITVDHEHHYQTIAPTDNPVINGVAMPIDYQITTPNVGQSPAKAPFAPFETITVPEYTALLGTTRAGIQKLLQEYMSGLAAPPAHVYIIFTKLPVQQQACYTAGGGGELRVIIRFGKYTAIDPADKETSIPGQESKRGWTQQGKLERWQKATIIHEMGHMLHAFTNTNKFMAAAVDARTAADSPAPIQPEMFHIANINQQILTALNAQHYATKWTYAKANPAEVVAEVWTALMHGETVPRGLAAVYLAYGGMRNAAIDNTLRRLFPGRAIPALNEPDDALAYIP